MSEGESATAASCPRQARHHMGGCRHQGASRAGWQAGREAGAASGAARPTSLCCTPFVAACWTRLISKQLAAPSQFQQEDLRWLSWGWRARHQVTPGPRHTPCPAAHTWSARRSGVGGTVTSGGHTRLPLLVRILSRCVPAHVGVYVVRGCTLSLS